MLMPKDYFSFKIKGYTGEGTVMVGYCNWILFALAIWRI